MSSLLLTLPELYNSYKSWVIKHPQIISDYETTAKWVSYFIAGRIHNSHVVSEMVYCLSNLLVLFNDGIIRKTLDLKIDKPAENIKMWLTVIEYSEVFCELSFKKLWGNTGKWLIIVAIQVFKCVARFILIRKYKVSIIENPPISPLERGKLKDGNFNCRNPIDISQSELSSGSFTLNRSGRVIRKVDASPPLALRTWKPIQVELQPDIVTNQNLAKDIATRQTIAEYLYISKPITHLISMGVFGDMTWKPWIISLIMDISSLQLYKSTQKVSKNSLSKTQKLQLSKRTVLLVLYLIRSPFYEKYSQNKINAFLIALSKNVPLIRIICNPLLQYLPFWQSNYFHMWST